ncbi:MAG: hypothetical protein JEZ11_12845 [Desulfobacterales bacterium]|nr:hypothetical protein [Desulfobacterales bacterium]
MPFSRPDRHLSPIRSFLLACLWTFFFSLLVTPLDAAQWDAEWGGHLRLRGEAGWPDQRSVYAPFGTDPLVDGSIDLRLKNRVFWGDAVDLETHYEFIATGGDTRQKGSALAGGVLSTSVLTSLSTVNDRRRLMDLTATVDEASGHVAYHRLDRLALSLRGQRARVTLGRQALTWGNGLVFNPMDLFNPFAPTDTDRDYKLGDDMALVQMPVSPAGDLQLLYVPRRNLQTENVDWNDSSAAAKLHCAVGTTEFDVMVSRHYRDYVFGLGAAGYLADAAWRMDATWTRRFGVGGRSEFFSLVANLDYSWTWGGKNWYGLMELFANGLGGDDPAAALADPVMVERLDRGELFTLGRAYLAAQLQYEIHPLLNLALTAITNVADPCGIFQPRAVWSLTQNTQLTLGGSLYWGRSGTEFGGFRIVASGPWIHPSDSAYLRLSFFF